jgi:membrane protease YdiL (CAAX protease family)
MTELQTHSVSGNPHIAMAMKGKKIPPIPLSMLVAIIIVVLSTILGGIATIALFGKDGIAPVTAAAGESPLFSGVRFASLLILSFAPVFLLVWLWMKAYEGRSFASVGFVTPPGLSTYLKGLAGGIMFFGLSVGIIALAGGISAGEQNLPSHGPAAISGVVIVLLGWMVQGAGEEVLCRGWLLQVVGARSGAWIGVIVSSIIFSALHAVNPDVGVVSFINIALVGIFLSLYALREGGIWGVSGWHATWNWTQGNIFGMQVSGTHASGGSVFNFSTGGPDLLTGGRFGPEGGLAVTLVLLAGVLTLLKYFPPDMTLPAGSSGRISPAPEGFS